MAKRDIIVIGASAGGVDALKILAAGLPAGLQASVFVVLHIGNGINGESYLPEILSRAGALPAVRAKEGEHPELGHIYVAPPDCHMLLERGRIHLSHGPKENRTRPAINPLFRSAAASYDGRVAGVILTGMLDDGVAGLAEIKRQGGVSVVEDPHTAEFASMPENAIARVEVNHILPIGRIPDLLAQLAGSAQEYVKNDEPMEKKNSPLTCPECRGPLWEERQGRIVEFACRVGHRYSPLAMEYEHHSTVERSLWSSIVALEEAADITEKLAVDLGPVSADDIRRKREQAAVLRAMLSQIPGPEKDG